MEAPHSEPFAAAPDPDACARLSLAALQQMLPSGVIIERVEEITVSGKPVRSVNLVCAYDVATGKTKWTLDLCGE